MPVLELITRVISSIHNTFKKGESKVVLKYHLKKIYRLKVSRVWNNLIYNWNDINSKRTSSRCLQGHNLYHRVTGFMHTLSFLSTLVFFLNFPYLKRIFCTPKLCNTKCSTPCSFKSQRAPYLFTWSIYWKTIPCSWNARAHSPEFVVSMHSTRCAVQ